MHSYAIGDIQGCYQALRRLLAAIDFQPSRDRLWFVGDLVNRGPDSLAVLRFIRDLGDRARVVLGNHDLHCLAAAYGARKPHAGDTLKQVIEAPDSHELIEWLCQCPLLYEDPDYPYVMVHAGIPPAWDMHTARGCARELEQVLRGQGRRGFLRHMYGNGPRQWHPDLNGMDRLRYITNAFTRLRYCYADGRMEFHEDRPPGEQDETLIPWFEIPWRRTRGQPIIFGHWASLQARAPLDPAAGVFHVDTGCVWGGSLSAFRLEDKKIFRVPGLNSSA